MHGLPVNTVHVLEVETVAIGTPSLVEYLFPLLVIVHRGNHVVEINFFTQVGLAGCQGSDIEFITFHECGGLHVSRSNHENLVGYYLVLLLGKIIDMHAAATTIPQVAAVTHEAAIVACANREFHDAVSDAVNVNTHGIIIGFCFAFFILGRIFGGVFRLFITCIHLVILRQEW